MLRKIISLTLTLSFLLQQTVFAYTASLNLSAYLNPGPNLTVSDRFRPISLRYFSYQVLTNDFKVLLDKGDYAKSSGHQDTKSPEKEDSVLKEAAKELMDYFKIGLSLPNEKFWVNLRPDSRDEIIDEELAKTDLGKVMLEADLKLKQDTSLFTSPQSPQGKEYWNKLYKKAGELFGTENITIPTLTRPWIVPGEIILRESNDKSSQGAYIYKANLKVMLEEDYLGGGSRTAPTSVFSDPRLKELNSYSTQLIRELILPRLTQKVNSSKDYANLRQVYFSLILARWFKESFGSQKTENRAQSTEKTDNYVNLIDSNNLTNLTSKQAWDKTTYFNAYQKSFQEGEYNLSEPIYTPTGQVIRRYMSGGAHLMVKSTNPGIYAAASAAERKPGEILFDRNTFEEQGIGSPLEIKARIQSALEEIVSLSEQYKNTEDAKRISIVISGYLRDLKEDKKSLSALRESLDKIITDIKEFLPSEDRRDSNVVSVENKISALKLLRESLTPEGIILEALKEQWPFLEGLLSETPSYSEFGIEGGLQIGKGIKCKWVKSSISSRRIELYIYEHISGISEALRISVDKVDKYNPIIVQIADSAVKLAVDNMAIAQSQDLSKDIITIVILSGYKDKIPAEGILTIKNAIKKGGVFQAAKELRKIVLFGAKDYKDIFNYMELALMDEKFYNSNDYYKEALEIILKRYKGRFVSEEKFNELKELEKPEYELENNNLISAAKGLMDVIGNISKQKGLGDDAVKQAGDMELYAFLQNISDDLENSDNTRSVDPSLEEGAVEASSSMVTSENTASGLPVGGIDFRQMNMLVQPVGSFAGLDFSLPALSKAEIESFDLDEELAVIRDMVKVGMAPSGRRLKEYLAVCFEKGETRDKIDDLILCLADIFELQQFEAGETSPEYKEALVIADTRRYTIKEDRFAVSEKNPYSLN